MKITFQDITGTTLGTVENVEGKLVGSTDEMQMFADNWITVGDGDRTVGDFMDTFADYQGGHLFSKAE